MTMDKMIHRLFSGQRLGDQDLDSKGKLEVCKRVNVIDLNSIF